MNYIYIWHTNSIYLSKFQVNTVTDIVVIRQNEFSNVRVMVIGVGSELNCTMPQQIVFLHSKNYNVLKL